MKTAAILLLHIVLTVPLLAQWKSEGVPVPDEPFRKSDGAFGAMLLLTDEPQEFIDAWEKPETPAIKTTDVAKRGIPIVAFVLFVGCKEVKGVCNSTVDFTVLRPDGSEYAKASGAELWKDKPAPAADVIELSLANLGIRIEPEDPSGRYLVKAFVHDLNAFKTIAVEQAFTVAE